MRIIQSALLAILLLLLSCNRVDPLIESDIILDDLTDKTDYSIEMLVDCRYFEGKKTRKIEVDQHMYDSPELIELKAGFHRIVIFTKNDDDNPDVIRIAILDEERGEPEWGLPPWTPHGVEIGTLSDQQLTSIYPRNIPEGFDFPLVVVVGEQVTESTDNLLATAGSTSFLLKRGVGSAWISSDVDMLVIDSRSSAIQTGILTAPPDSLSATIEQDTRIAAGSYVNISADLYISAGITLSIEEGVFITIDPQVNIYNEGVINIAGLPTDPVTITCSDNQAYWGGIISSGSGNRVKASHVIFARSGYHEGDDYDWGHAHRQALFFNQGGSLSVDHCYMIDHIGQVFYPLSARLEIEYCLVQRVKTGGQINHSQLLINHSVFTDFPDDTQVYQDVDNDGLYINDTDATITNSVFMYAKDDGLDSGASPGGEITINNTRFESNFHEGAALSSGNGVVKNHYISHSLFMDNGQGMELGYSSENHNVYADSCSFIRNGIGIRFGDCYEWPHKGTMHISNSLSLDNVTADIWNMKREHWSADTFRMEFDNVMVSVANPMYPELIIHTIDE